MIKVSQRNTFMTGGNSSELAMKYQTGRYWRSSYDSLAKALACFTDCIKKLPKIELHKFG